MVECISLFFFLYFSSLASFDFTVLLSMDGWHGMDREHGSNRSFSVVRESLSHVVYTIDSVSSLREPNL